MCTYLSADGPGNKHASTGTKEFWHLLTKAYTFCFIITSEMLIRHTPAGVHKNMVHKTLITRCDYGVNLIKNRQALR